MNERFTSDLLFIIIVLVIAAILGFLIGYFFVLIRKRKSERHLKEQIAGIEKDLSLCQNNRKDLELKAKNLELKANSFESEAHDLRNKLQTALTTVPETSFDPSVAQKYMKKNVVADDLKIIEGIGPAIQGVLKGQGVDTWLKLSSSESEEIRAILAASGRRGLKSHDPESWPHQAKLAADGKWAELKELQDKLVGGKPRKA